MRVWRRVERCRHQIGVGLSGNISMRVCHLKQYILTNPIRHPTIDKALPTGALDSPRGLVCGLLEVL